VANRQKRPILRARGSPVKTIVFSLAFFVLYGFHATAQDTSEAAIQSKIVALEKAWNQAYKAGDMKALDELLDNAIVLINDDGSVQSKADFLASVRATNSQEQQVAPESMHVHVFGSVAIASGVMRVKGVENGKPYTRREQFVDTWLFKTGKWVCIATDATPILH
jgi:ketosteroid isomerase-like protein